MHSYNVLDVIVAVIIAGAIFLGYYRGLVAQLVSIAGFFIAYVVAYLLYDEVADFLSRIMPLHALSSIEQYAFIIEGLNLDVYLYNAISFTLLFFVAKIGMSTLGSFLQLFTKMPGIKAINKWSGALLALLEAILILVIAVHVMTALPSPKLQVVLSESKSAAFVVENMPDAALKLKELWGGRAESDEQ
jgi:uncharacterized membrane protein required for colicin V production